MNDRETLSCAVSRMKPADAGTAFDRLASRYDTWYTTPLGAFADARQKEAIFALAGVRPGEWALDVGCGTGNYTLALARQLEQGSRGAEEPVGAGLPPAPRLGLRARPFLQPVGVGGTAATLRPANLVELCLHPSLAFRQHRPAGPGVGTCGPPVAAALRSFSGSEGEMLASSSRSGSLSPSTYIHLGSF